MRSWRGGNNSKQVPEVAKQNEAKAGNSQILHDHKQSTYTIDLGLLAVTY